MLLHEGAIIVGIYGESAFRLNISDPIRGVTCKSSTEAHSVWEAACSSGMGSYQPRLKL